MSIGSVRFECAKLFVDLLRALYDWIEYTPPRAPARPSYEPEAPASAFPQTMHSLALRARRKDNGVVLCASQS